MLQKHKLHYLLLCMLPGFLAFHPPLATWVVAKLGSLPPYLFGVWFIYIGLLWHWQRQPKN